MKLTKSKQLLADAIHASGKGWRHGAISAAQCKSDLTISFYRDKPYKDGIKWWGEHIDGADIPCAKLSPNWHQTCLSREEYFSAYPAEPVADADGWIEWNGGDRPTGVFAEDVEVKLRDGCVITKSAGVIDWRHFDNRSDVVAYRLHKPEVRTELCESVMRSIPEPEYDDVDSRLAKALELVKAAAPHLLSDKYKFNGDEVMGERKQTIEQLAQDYRDTKGRAERLQQEADDAKAATDAKRALLVEAGKVLGLDVSPITIKQEPELVITDWRDLMIGDEVEYSLGGQKHSIGMIGKVVKIDPNDDDMRIRLRFGDGTTGWPSKWRFIRRPLTTRTHHAKQSNSNSWRHRSDFNMGLANWISRFGNRHPVCAYRSRKAF